MPPKKKTTTGKKVKKPLKQKKTTSTSQQVQNVKQVVNVTVQSGSSSTRRRSTQKPSEPKKQQGPSLYDMILYRNSALKEQAPISNNSTLTYDVEQIKNKLNSLSNYTVKRLSRAEMRDDWANRFHGSEPASEPVSEPVTEPVSEPVSGSASSLPGITLTSGLLGPNDKVSNLLKKEIREAYGVKSVNELRKINSRFDGNPDNVYRSAHNLWWQDNRGITSGDDEEPRFRREFRSDGITEIERISLET